MYNIFFEEHNDKEIKSIIHQRKQLIKIIDIINMYFKLFILL